MKLWTYHWFIAFINWCRKWKWFDIYIYGKSLNLEDFCRNPAEVLRDTYFPFIVKEVKAYSVINLRIGYIPYVFGYSPANSWPISMGNHGICWKGDKWAIVDLRVWNPWLTKFCNAMFFFQFAISLWHYIPIPYVSMCIKIVPWYFQFGIGWGPETRSKRIADKEYEIWYDAVLCGKFRFVNEKTSNERILNPTDVTGYWEGVI